MRRLRLLAAIPAGPALAVGKKAHASLGACYLRSRQASVERAAKARARAVLVVHYDDNPWDPPAARWASAGPCPRYGSGVREGRTARTRRPRLGLGVILRHRPQPLPLRRDAGGAAAGAAGGGAHGVRVQQRVVPTPYADNGVRGWAREQRFGRRPYQRAASRPSPRLVGPTDGTSHLCVAAAPDAALLPRVRRGAEALDLARCEAAPRRSTWPCPREAPGTRSTHWAAASASGGCTKRRSSTPTR
ncbi:hypothetical protein SBADM41S_01737 [Streptomyces badius]